MLDERGDPAEGGLEGREPVRGLFRNIESYLHEICDPLPLCWEAPGRQWASRVKGIESTHICLSSSYSLRNSSEVAFEAWFRSWKL